jgi:membrane protease YdiL (CAAX protease family)
MASPDLRVPPLASARLAAALFALALPTLVTWLYFVAYAGHPWMQAFYGGGKLVQFALPLVCMLLLERSRPRFALPEARGLIWGGLFGLTVVAAMLALYYGELKHSPLLAGAPEAIAEKLDDIGINTPLKFVGLAVFYSLLHSLLEEYYWRWFVFGRLREQWPLSAAIMVSSLGFMAHHVLVLGEFLGGFGPATGFFSLSIAVGGGVWAWIYNRTGTLYGSWLSHLLVDAGIMWMGYELAFQPGHRLG